jgi:hypothetical protein
MALPSISTPEFITHIPSTGEEIKFRPFLVKEEKILLMAMEGEDAIEIQNAILNILQNCIITEGVDVPNLAMFDIEFLFLQLRGKSVGEVIDLKVGHNNSECNHKSDVQVRIDDIKVQGEQTEKKIMLTDDVGVMLRYPSIKDAAYMSDDPAKALFSVITRCVDYVFDAENVYNDFSESEIDDWINTLNQAQFQKIVDFFSDAPALKHDVTWTCEKCGEEETITLQGLQSFFI